VTADIVLLAASVGFLCLLAWSARSGAIGTKGGLVRRDRSPLGFWFLAVALGLLGAMFLVQAVLGIIRRSR
jgi:hypothetical protein